MDEQQKAEAQNECRVLTELVGGPFIVRVVDHFVELERLWIIMEYADGGDLASRIETQKKEGKPFEEAVIVDWVVQLCLALRHAHLRKVLHRDLKPQNVFLMRDGAVRLGDFGISRVLSSTLSVVNTCVGTPLYLSPEMCEGLAYDSKCDSWSLGVMLFEMCSLHHPFEASVMLPHIARLRGNTTSPLQHCASLHLAAPRCISLIWCTSSAIGDASTHTQDLPR